MLCQSVLKKTINKLACVASAKGKGEEGGKDKNTRKKGRGETGEERRKGSSLPSLLPSPPSSFFPRIFCPPYPLSLSHCACYAGYNQAYGKVRAELGFLQASYLACFENLKSLIICDEKYIGKS